MTFPRAPETEEEREACATTVHDEWCKSIDPSDTYGCSRYPGHTGKHVAAGTRRVYAVWDSK